MQRTLKVVNESLIDLLKNSNLKFAAAGVSRNLAKSVAFDVYLSLLKDMVDSSEESKADDMRQKVLNLFPAESSATESDKES